MVQDEKKHVTEGELHDSHRDCKKPIFHVMPYSGWGSDPCGPFFYKGRYHLFYQHLRHSCQWFWGLCWDHVTSTDLVHWERCPVAICPTGGWYDADGCFSGSVQVDPETTVPVLFYTGVWLKSNPHCGPAPPQEYDIGLRFVEHQLMAVPEDVDDPYLSSWKKLPKPWIKHPPKNAPLTAWRDPFFLQKGDGQGKEWALLLSIGIRGKGGCVLMYRSKHLTKGWYFAGVVASSTNKEVLGTDWECPIITKLTPLPNTYHPICFAPPELSPTSSSSSLPVVEVLACATDIMKGTPPANTMSVIHSDTCSEVSSGTLNNSVAHMKPLSVSSPVKPSAPPGRPRGSVHFNDQIISYPSSYYLLEEDAGVDSGSVVGSQMGSASFLRASSSTGSSLSLDTLALAPAEVGGAVEGGKKLVMNEFLESLDTLEGVEISAQRIKSTSMIYTEISMGVDEEVAEHEVDEKYSWLFSISPDACTNPIYYFMGSYDDDRRKYDLEKALGPMQLDLGRTLYAPNCWQDPQGRNILWGWMQEHRADTPKAPCQSDLYSYAGCISTPRLLYQKGRRLVQRPLPEIAKLRTPVRLITKNVPLDSHQMVPLQGVSGVHLDLELSFSCHKASHVGLMLKSWRSSGEGTAMVVVDVNRSELRVVFLNNPEGHDPTACLGPPPVAEAARLNEEGDEASAPQDRSQHRAVMRADHEWNCPMALLSSINPLNDADPHPSFLLNVLKALEEDDPNVKWVGGKLHWPSGTPLHLRVLLDGTCLEIFTGSGEVLSTRTYRGYPPPGVDSDAGICFFSLGGESTLTHLAAYEMGCAWKDEDVPHESIEVKMMAGRSSGQDSGCMNGVPHVVSAMAPAVSLEAVHSGPQIMRPGSNKVMETVFEEAVLPPLHQVSSGSQDLAPNGDMECMKDQPNGHLDTLSRLVSLGEDMERRRSLEDIPGLPISSAQGLDLLDWILERAMNTTSKDELKHFNDSYDDIDQEWWAEFHSQVHDEEIRKHWWREADAAIMAKRRGEAYTPAMHLARVREKMG